MKEKFKKFFAPTKFKRLFDIVVSFFALIILSPLFLVICIANLLTPNTSVFFSHERRGRKGKPFKIYKFQTMKNNTPNVATGDLENPEQYITKVGKFLRKTSLDEFPQFVNILKGEMSLVGPRPYLYREKEDLGEYYYNSITKVKPGITGYWQVNGRNDVDFEERAYMDTYYIEHRGIVMDLKIVLKTLLLIIILL